RGPPHGGVRSRYKAGPKEPNPRPSTNPALAADARTPRRTRPPGVGHPHRGVRSRYKAGPKEAKPRASTNPATRRRASPPRGEVSVQSRAQRGETSRLDEPGHPASGIPTEGRGLGTKPGPKRRNLPPRRTRPPGVGHPHRGVRSRYKAGPKEAKPRTSMHRM